MSINYLNSLSSPDFESKYLVLKKNKKDKFKSISFSNKQSLLDKMLEGIKSIFGHSTLAKVAKLITTQLKEKPTLTESEQKAVNTLYNKIQKFNSSPWHPKVNVQITENIEKAVKPIIGKPPSAETGEKPAMVVPKPHLPSPPSTKPTVESPPPQKPILPASIKTTAESTIPTPPPKKQPPEPTLPPPAPSIKPALGSNIPTTAPQTLTPPQLQPAAPTILPTSTKIPLSCMGISNKQPNGLTYNRCCLNSTLKLLWATPGFREELTKNDFRKINQMSQILTKLLTKFDNNPVGELDQNDPVMQPLIQILEMWFPGMEQYKQQDAEEIFNRILMELKNNDPPDTPAFLSFREKTTRKETNPPVKISTIDEKKPDQTNIYTVSLPEDSPSWSLADDFSTGTDRIQPLDQKNVEVQKKDGKTSPINNEQFASVVQQLGQNVQYHSLCLIRGEPPPNHLFIQLARFSNPLEEKDVEKFFNEEVKVYTSHEELVQMAKDWGALKRTTKVQVPFILNAHQDNKDQSSLVYQLKAVVVHDGEFISSGHYYTYVPDPSSPLTEAGLPTKWIMHNDKQVIEVPLEQILDKLEHHAYLFSYERIG